MQDGRGKWRKLKFFPFAQDTLVPSCGSKIRSKSLYLLRFSRYWHFSIFCENPRWPPKVAKIEIFPHLTGDSCTTLWIKNLLGKKKKKKFARNRCISYGFRDIDTFSFSAKILDGRQKWRKLKFSPFPQDTVVPPCGSKIHSKSLYLLRFSRYWHFFIFRKNPRWPPKVAKIEISLLCTGHCCTTLWVKKFARNHSISYGFRDIDTFPFSAKIQDGRRKWWKLKFHPFPQDTVVPRCG